MFKYLLLIKQTLMLDICINIFFFFGFCVCLQGLLKGLSATCKRRDSLLSAARPRASSRWPYLTGLIMRLQLRPPSEPSLHPCLSVINAVESISIKKNIVLRVVTHNIVHVHNSGCHLDDQNVFANIKAR